MYWKLTWAYPPITQSWGTNVWNLNIMAKRECIE